MLSCIYAGLEEKRRLLLGQSGINADLIQKVVLWLCKKVQGEQLLEYLSMLQHYVKCSHMIEIIKMISGEWNASNTVHVLYILSLRSKIELNCMFFNIITMSCYSIIFEIIFTFSVFLSQAIILSSALCTISFFFSEVPR